MKIATWDFSRLVKILMWTDVFRIIVYVSHFCSVIFCYVMCCVFRLYGWRWTKSFISPTGANAVRRHHITVDASGAIWRAAARRARPRAFTGGRRSTIVGSIPINLAAAQRPTGNGFTAGTSTRTGNCSIGLWWLLVCFRGGEGRRRHKMAAAAAVITSGSGLPRRHLGSCGLMVGVFVCKVRRRTPAAKVKRRRTIHSVGLVEWWWYLWCNPSCGVHERNR